MTLIAAADRHFAWMLGEAPAPDGLRLTQEGVDEAWVLRWLRRTLPTLGGEGSWLMAVDGEVVGLCSYKQAPDAKGMVEIGYAVAPDRRRLGYATQGVAALVTRARGDPRVSTLTAETALANLASRRVLELNRFAPVGRSHDDDEGEMIVWRRGV